MEINRVYCEDCRDTMARMPDGFVDLTVTSPPYDNLRTYKNNIDKVWGEHIWKPIIEDLYRVTKKGGVVVWVVGDATIKGSETGTSFKQALWAKECGFNLHDTMIYRKKGVGACGSNYCYWQSFEYMFVWTIGKPNTVNRLRDKPNSTAGTTRKNNKKCIELGTRTNRPGVMISKFGIRENIWEYQTGMFSGDTKTSHPAPFPEQLANDHIISWSNEGDLIYDPFMGSGTTAKTALLNDRNWIGSEISSEYCELIEKRIASLKED